jgi:hypothetical protein
MLDNKNLGELKFEVDSFYVAAEIIRSAKRIDPPLDGLLLEACLLTFNLSGNFFYGPWKKNDLRVKDFVPNGIPKKERPKQTAELRAICRALDETIAHLSRRPHHAGLQEGTNQIYGFAEDAGPRRKTICRFRSPTYPRSTRCFECKPACLKVLNIQNVESLARR